jgi:hypothetical protein
MGEAQNQPFQLSFNPRLRIEFQGSRVTSDGGLILVRELDERLSVSDLIAQHITDPRGKNTQFPLTDLVRQSVYRRLTGEQSERALAFLASLEDPPRLGDLVAALIPAGAP